MSTLKQDVTDVSLSLVYDFLLVALIFSWMAAILLALIEVSLWIVFGIFLLGCGFLSGILYFNRKSEEEEKAKLAAENAEPAETSDKQPEEKSKQKENDTSAKK